MEIKNAAFRMQATHCKISAIKDRFHDSGGTDGGNGDGLWVCPLFSEFCVMVKNWMIPKNE